MKDTEGICLRTRFVAGIIAILFDSRNARPKRTGKYVYNFYKAGAEIYGFTDVKTLSRLARVMRATY